MYQESELVGFAMLCAVGTGVVATPIETPSADPRPIVPRLERACEAPAVRKASEARGWSVRSLFAAWVVGR